MNPRFRKAPSQHKAEQHRLFTFEILEERNLLSLTPDFAAQVVIFSPQGSRADRGPAMLANSQLIQQQWESWGWTFQLEDAVEVINGTRPGFAYRDFFDVQDEAFAVLQSRGIYNPTANYLIFAEDVNIPGIAAQANRESAIFYDGVMEGMVSGDQTSIGAIGHEFGHVVGLGHENCDGSEFFNRPTQTRGPMCNAAGWPNAIFPPAWQSPLIEHEQGVDLAEFEGGYELPITYLSDLPWVSATIDTGSIQRDLSFGGNVLGLNNNPWGAGYPKGIGTSSNSTIVYDLAGDYVRFQSSIGIDDEVGNSGSVTFQVLADGALVYSSGVVTGASTHQYIDVDVTGVNELQLVVGDARNGTANDHANWANARLIGTDYPDFSLSGKSQTIRDGDGFPSTIDGTDFGSTSLGATGPIGEFVLSNVGTAIGTVADIQVPTGFKIVSAPSYVEPGASMTLQIQLETEVPGNKSGFVELTTNAEGSEKNYLFKVTGQVLGGNATTTYVSDIITPADATNGFGPIELDRSNGGFGSNDGGTITLQGQRYSKGIGAHAADNGQTRAEIVVPLNGQYDWFLSDVGIDDEVGSNGSVTFLVQVDNGPIYEIGPLFGDSPTESFEVPVTGGNVLRLILDPANGSANAISSDHADWADARLITVDELNADFDNSGLVSGSDFFAWQRGLGSGSTQQQGDANGDSQVDSADLEVWSHQYGQTTVLSATANAETIATSLEPLSSSTLVAVASNSALEPVASNSALEPVASTIEDENAITSPSIDLRGIGATRSRPPFHAGRLLVHMQPHNSSSHRIGVSEESPESILVSNSDSSDSFQDATSSSNPNQSQPRLASRNDDSWQVNWRDLDRAFDEYL